MGGSAAAAAAGGWVSSLRGAATSTAAPLLEPLSEWLAPLPRARWAAAASAATYSNGVGGVAAAGGGGGGSGWGPYHPTTVRHLLPPPSPPRFNHLHRRRHGSLLSHNHNRYMHILTLPTVVNTPTISTPTEADTPPPLTCVTPAVADADARQRHHQECLQQQNHLGERAGHGTQRDGLAGVAGRFVERGGRGETERWGVGAAFCQVRKNMFKSAREEM